MLCSDVAACSGMPCDPPPRGSCPTRALTLFAWARLPSNRPPARHGSTTTPATAACSQQRATITAKIRSSPNLVSGTKKSIGTVHGSIRGVSLLSNSRLIFQDIFQWVQAKSCSFSIYQWLGARLLYLQCISTGDTAVLHQASINTEVTWLVLTSRITVACNYNSAPV